MRCLWMVALFLVPATVITPAQQATPSTDATQPAGRSPAQKLTPPKPINNVEAQFSNEARTKKISGRCLVSLVVDAQGNPQLMKITRCTDSSFEKSSLEAAAKYRFKPATTQEGKPVPVTTQIEIEYHLYDGTPVTPIRYRFSSPPGTTSAEPSADGVYPLTNLSTPPTMTKLSDEGYGPLAFASESNGGCDIVLTVSAKGIPSDAQVTHCETPSLEKAAVQSILTSRYKPGMVNGKAVPMRASIHLEYDGDTPK
jgi:TonB family protein